MVETEILTGFAGLAGVFALRYGLKKHRQYKKK
jgi:hypothetical protein